jgi:hypothetical protein
MQKTIPVHLASTHKLIECAFSQGINESWYLPLLSILHENLSDRSLSQVIANITGKDYHQVLNDVYGLDSIDAYPPDVINMLIDKLEVCGYTKWISEG